MLKCTMPKWSLLLFTWGALSFGGPAFAEWPEKPIRLIVPYSPGGGFDTFARAFAPELEQALGTDIIIDNVPGAGGRRGLQTMLKAKPDGYTITMFNVPGIVIAQVTGKLKAVDLNDIAWISSVSKANYSLVLSAKSDIGNLNDLCNLGRPAKFSATGPGSSSHTAAVVLMETASCPFTLVTGYEGSTEAALAVIRGEVDAMVTGIDSSSKFVVSGDAKIGLTFSADRMFDDVEAAGEIGDPELESLAQIRMFGAPPETPGDIIKKFSDAFEKAANSDRLVVWSQSANRPITFLNSEETAKTIETQFGVMEDFADAFN